MSQKKIKKGVNTGWGQNKPKKGNKKGVNTEWGQNEEEKPEEWGRYKPTVSHWARPRPPHEIKHQGFGGNLNPNWKWLEGTKKSRATLLVSDGKIIPKK